MDLHLYMYTVQDYASVFYYNNAVHLVACEDWVSECVIVA